MDYKAFFADVLEWIGQTNQAAVTHGLGTQAFWTWVADSTGAISQKYQGNRLVIKQMMMMIEWLEEVCENKD